jgi:O-methyltransferase involved in polyketide biosynthesis
MYIPPTAVDALLAFICRASAPGSAIVADSFETSIVDGTSPLKEAQVLKSFVEKEGAPLQFGIPAGTIEAFFQERGFGQVRCVDASWCKQRYFTGASRDRCVTPMFHFVYAAVGPAGDLP